VTVYPFIEAEKAAERNVARACELLEVSRSAYYAQRDTTPSPREVEEAELSAAIVRLHEVSKGVYGAPKIHDDLKDEGRQHGRKRVARIMREQGLRGRTPKRFKTTTLADPQAAARADLIKRDFTVDATKINTRWCGDFKCRRRHLMSYADVGTMPRSTVFACGGVVFRVERSA